MIHLDYQKMIEQLANDRYGNMKQSNLITKMILMEAKAAETPLEFPPANQDLYHDWWLKIKIGVVNFNHYMVGSIQLYERIILPTRAEVFGSRAG